MKIRFVIFHDRIEFFLFSRASMNLILLQESDFLMIQTHFDSLESE